MNDHSLERLRFLAGTDDVEFVAEPLTAVVVGIETREELRPQTIIRIGSLYLVETTEEPDNWYMGQLVGVEIVCHGAYGTLDDAVRAL